MAESLVLYSMHQRNLVSNPYALPSLRFLCQISTEQDFRLPPCSLYLAGANNIAKKSNLPTVLSTNFGSTGSFPAIFIFAHLWAKADIFVSKVLFNL